MDRRSDKIFAWLSKIRFGGVVLLLALVIVFAAAFLRPNGETLDVARDGKLVSANCVLVQTMRFTRCQHQVTRRISIPQSCVGLDREGMEKLYGEWQMETFAESEIAMSRDIELYCPLHYVLMANETGGLSIYQNRYGDAMAWLSDVQGKMSDYEEAMQERLLLGLGYDSMDELNAALKNGLH